MTIQTGRRSALTSTAALLIACAWGFADTSSAHATAGTAAHRTMLAAADTPDVTDAAAPVTANPPAARVATEADATTDRSIGPGSGISDGGTAAASAPVATANPAIAVASDDGSGWDKASLVGKIFIACGTLLTLGSAARMFMA